MATSAVLLRRSYDDAVSIRLTHFVLRVFPPFVKLSLSSPELALSGRRIRPVALRRTRFWFSKRTRHTVKRVPDGFWRNLGAYNFLKLINYLIIAYGDQYKFIFLFYFKSWRKSEAGPSIFKPDHQYSRVHQYINIRSINIR